jgi:hypothetical protein
MVSDEYFTCTARCVLVACESSRVAGNHSLRLKAGSGIVRFISCVLAWALHVEQFFWQRFGHFANVSFLVFSACRIWPLCCALTQGVSHRLVWSKSRKSISGHSMWELDSTGFSNYFVSSSQYHANKCLYVYILFYHPGNGQLANLRSHFHKP